MTDRLDPDLTEALARGREPRYQGARQPRRTEYPTNCSLARYPKLLASCIGATFRHV